MHSFINEFEYNAFSGARSQTRNIPQKNKIYDFYLKFSYKLYDSWEFEHNFITRATQQVLN